jgi:uncharacterized surface protein with fasciclin (FAS1) repeats
MVNVSAAGAVRLNGVSSVTTAEPVSNGVIHVVDAVIDY